MEMFRRFLGLLKQIEDGVLDQHEASFQVGTILKEIYIDSALKKSDKLEAAAAAAVASDPAAAVAALAANDAVREQNRGLTWSDYKKLREKEVIRRLFGSGG